MALAKKTLIMAIVGALVLILGVVGGIWFGIRFFKPEAPTQEASIPDPGPMIDLGQFTSTLADPQVHVIRLRVTVELSGLNVTERLADPGWVVMMKDEVMKTLKDQRYDAVRYAEGMEKLKQDLAVRLNAILPRVEGELAVRRVLFDEYMVQ
jgi:Flagellar basal body-associated protein